MGIDGEVTCHLTQRIAHGHLIGAGTGIDYQVFKITVTYVHSSASDLTADVTESDRGNSFRSAAVVDHGNRTVSAATREVTG